MGTTDAERWQANKTYGTVGANQQQEMSGLEFVQVLVDGTLPLNTMAETLGYDVTEAVSGRVVITAEPNGTLLNPAGTVHGGLHGHLARPAVWALPSRPLWKKASVRRRWNSKSHWCGRSRRRQD